MLDVHKAERKANCQVILLFIQRDGSGSYKFSSKDLCVSKNKENFINFNSHAMQCIQGSRINVQALPSDFAHRKEEFMVYVIIVLDNVRKDKFI